MPSELCLRTSDERDAVAAHGSAGTNIPTPLGILFRQEEALVLLARKVCPARLKRRSAAPVPSNSLGEPHKGRNYETNHHHYRDDRPHARCCKSRCSAKPLHRAHHRRFVLRLESVQSPWVSSP